MIYPEVVQWMISLMLLPLQPYSGIPMPTYNYYCHKCNTHFSYFQKMSESSFLKCKECGGKIERIISGGTGLIFKGSGFYLTDYKDEKKISTDNAEKNQKSIEKSEKKNNSKNTKAEEKSITKKTENTNE